MNPSTLVLYTGADNATVLILFAAVDWTGALAEIEIVPRPGNDPILLSSAPDGALSLIPDNVHGLLLTYSDELVGQLEIGEQGRWSGFKLNGAVRERVGAGKLVVAGPGQFFGAPRDVVAGPVAQGPSGTLVVESVVTLAPGDDAYIEQLGTPSAAIWRVGLPRGATGLTPDTSVLSTATLAPGQPATVTLDPSSTPEEPKLVFGLPKGDTGPTPDITILPTTTLAPGEPADVTLDPSGTPEAPKLAFSIPAGEQGLPGAPGEPLVLVVSDTTDTGLGGWWVTRDYHGAATCDYLRTEMLVGEADGVTLALRKNGATVRSGIALGAGVTVITDLGLVLAEGDQVSVHRVGGGTLTGPWMMLVQIDGRAP